MWRLFKKKNEVKVVQPLSKRLEEAVGRLEVVKSRLSNRVRVLESRSKELFEAIVKAQVDRDNERAVMYANELAELRKMLRKAIHSELSLEGVIHRIQTAKDFDEIVDVLTPLREVLIQVGRDIRGVAPELSGNLNSIMDVFDEVTVNLGTFNEISGVRSSTDDEAEKILAEASAIAAERAKSRLSEVEI
ncbi:MAG: Snf7 family protein [Candidatus Caldarchaeales archaeon]